MAWRNYYNVISSHKQKGTTTPSMPLGLITFHHFYSKKKLALLQALTKTHALQGIFKRGRPGMLLISGPDEIGVGRYIGEVKRMRWQRVEVRGLAPAMSLTLSEGGKRGNLVEVENGKVRDVIAFARERGGVEVEEWVKGRMGFIKEADDEE